MGQDNPWLLIGLILAGGAVAKWWHDDCQAARRGAPHPRAFPGATPAGSLAILVATGGALILLAAETAGEHALGLTPRSKAG